VREELSTVIVGAVAHVRLWHLLGVVILKILHKKSYCRQTPSLAKQPQKLTKMG
jgi:hypothetical protein